MTGESDEIKKEPLDLCLHRLNEHLDDEKKTGHRHRSNHSVPSPMMLSGTQVATGEGWFLVIVVGKHTCSGKIMESLEQETEDTPLQEKLEAIATDIGYLGMISASITVAVLFLRFFIETGSSEAGFEWGINIGTYLQWWFEYIIVGVTIVVVAVPEGLPLAVIISLAYSVRKMLIEKNFVKRLAACEIMGGANNICSDKTGTLTKNEMNVVKYWQGSTREFDMNQKKYNLGDHFKNESVGQLFLQALACNTVGNAKESNATDKAILKMYERFGYNVEDMRDKHIPEPFIRFQFTSKRKKMGTVLTNITDSETGYDKRVVVKGASEIVLDSCEFYIDEHGKKHSLPEQMKKEIKKNVIESFAKDAYRTICVAYKDLEAGEGGQDHDEEDEDGLSRRVEKSGLTCLCILGISDVIRPEVPDAVATCQNA